MSIKYQFSKRTKADALRAIYHVCFCNQALAENFDHILPRGHEDLARKYGIDMAGEENCGPLCTRCHYLKNKQEASLDWSKPKQVAAFLLFWQDFHFDSKGKRRARKAKPNKQIVANLRTQNELRDTARAARASGNDDGGYEAMRDRAKKRREIHRRRGSARKRQSF